MRRSSVPEFWQFSETLHKPYFLSRLGDQLVSDIVTGIAEATTVLAEPVSPPPLLRDPDDDYLVALAREAGAEAIISGDRDLLDHPELEPPAIDARSACQILGLVD